MNLAASCYFNADFYAIKSPSFLKERWRTYRDPGIDDILNKAQHNKAQVKAPIKKCVTSVFLYRMLGAWYGHRRKKHRWF